MFELAFRLHGGGDLWASVARGVAWSVGWMIARGLGLPAALVVLVLLGASWWWFSRRRRSVRS